MLLHHFTSRTGPHRDPSTAARLPGDRRAQGRHDRAARGARAAPRRLRDPTQGAEVLALRRRPAAGLARAGRQALAAGVDLARRPLLPALRARAAPHQVRGESTPFYLWSRGAHRRIGEALPDVRLDRRRPRPGRPGLQQLDAPVVRRPRAGGRLRDRVRAARTSGCGPGWAPFWRYRELGMYGEQLAHLHRYVDPERILVVALPRPRRRARAARSTGSAGSSASARAMVDSIPRDNSRSFVAAGVATARVRAGRARRGTARPVRAAGGVAAARTPLVAGLLGDRRGRAPAAARRRSSGERLVASYADDVDLLSRAHRAGLRRLALSRRAAGSFAQRAATGAERSGSAHQVTRSCAPSGRAAST